MGFVSRMESPGGCNENMGEQATVSGEIPVAECLCIEYPAYVRNVESALDTIGGPDAVSNLENARNDGLLPLHWRNDTTAHPISGERSRNPGLLLRLSRRSPDGSNGDGDDVDVEVVSIVKVSYRFPGTSDYAFNDSGDVLEAKDSWVPGTAEIGEVSEPLATVPEYFSKVDYPVDYAFTVVGARSNRSKARRSKVVYGQEPKMVRLSFQNMGGVPSIKELTSPTDEIRRCWDFLFELFEGRPIWSYSMLMNSVGNKWSNVIVADVLTNLTYKFRTGPWTGMRILRGYDPRQEDEARKYQRIGYTLPRQWFIRAQKRGVLKKLRAEGGSVKEYNRFLSIPHTYTITLQLCDLDDPEIESILEDEDHVTSCCTEGYGWFSATKWDQMMDIVNDRFSCLIESSPYQHIVKESMKNAKLQAEESDILPVDLMGNVLEELEVVDGGEGDGDDDDDEDEDEDDLDDGDVDLDDEDEYEVEDLFGDAELEALDAMEGSRNAGGASEKGEGSEDAD